MGALPCGTESIASPALTVLTNQTLLAQITGFQRGIPLELVELRDAFVAAACRRSTRKCKCDYHVKKRAGQSMVWEAAMIRGELRLVQKLYGMMRSREYAHDRLVKQDNVGPYAISHGRLDVLQWLETATEVRQPSWSHLLVFALKYQKREIALWLLNERPSLCRNVTSDCLSFTAIWGDLEILKKLLQLNADALDGNSDVMDFAAIYGWLDMIQFLHFNTNAPCTTTAIDKAAMNGHLEVVKFLHAHRPEGCTTDAMDEAATSGELDVVKFLHENRTEGATTKAMDGAAAHGFLNIVQFLHANRTEGCTKAAMDLAARHGHLDVVKFLHEQRTEGCTTRAMDGAAKGGHLDVVRWLHDNRREGCTDTAIYYATTDGNFDMFKFLLESGHVRDIALRVRAFTNAVKHGHFRFLGLLYGEKKPLPEIFQLAVLKDGFYHYTNRARPELTS